jgi:hypothetical protein
MANGISNVLSTRVKSPSIPANIPSVGADPVGFLATLSRKGGWDGNHFFAAIAPMCLTDRVHKNVQQQRCLNIGFVMQTPVPGILAGELVGGRRRMVKDA